MIGTLALLGMIGFGDNTSTYECTAKTIATITASDTTLETYTIDPTRVVRTRNSIDLIGKRHTISFEITITEADGRLYTYQRETETTRMFYFDDASGLIISFSRNPDVFPQQVTVRHCRKLQRGE